MRTSAPARAWRTASATVANGLAAEPSAGPPADPGGPTKSTAGAISRAFSALPDHGGAASHATRQSSTKDQSLTGAVWCLLPRRTSERPHAPDVFGRLG